MQPAVIVPASQQLMDTIFTKCAAGTSTCKGGWSQVLASGSSGTSGKPQQGSWPRKPKPSGEGLAEMR